MPITSISLEALRKPTPISFILYSADISRPRQFIALSYMWGTEEATQVILINGQSFLVRRNLWEFLVRIQRADVKYRVPIWIDAICIDQNDVLERNHQVSLMGLIYSNARLVISWLGLNDEKYTQGLDWWQELRSLRRQNSQGWPKTTIPWSQLIALYYHEYWTRTWVIQEVVLPHDVEIWVGTRTMNHQVLAWIAETLPLRLSRTTGRNEILDTPAMSIMTRRALHHSQQCTVSKRPQTDLLNLLDISKTSFCQDVRDRVFAIISLIDAEQRAELNIMPNYSQSALQLCRNIDKKVQKYIIHHGLEPYVEYLHLLHEVLEIPDSVDVRPSWRMTSGHNERQVILLPKYTDATGYVYGAIGDKRSQTEREEEAKERLEQGGGVSLLFAHW
jgi:hypothetical protein